MASAHQEALSRILDGVGDEYSCTSTDPIPSHP